MSRHIDPRWEITVQDVKAMLDRGEPVALIDVRQPEEYETARIEGAHLFPLPHLRESVGHIEKIAEGKMVVTHCHHGHRSVQAAAFLREAGMGRVVSMAGGIHAWSMEIDSSVPMY